MLDRAVKPVGIQSPQAVLGVKHSQHAVELEEHDGVLRPGHAQGRWHHGEGEGVFRLLGGVVG